MGRAQGKAAKGTGVTRDLSRRSSGEGSTKRELGLSPGARMKKDCEARLRRLADGETILALGTAEELQEIGAELGSGGGWTFVVLTSRRLLFANWARPDQPHREIALDEVSAWADGTQYHSYALVLTHPPKVRRQHAPAHRFLWFAWGNAQVDRGHTTTIFRFSRRDTEAATALRSVLEHRRLGHEVLHFKEVSRAERTRGSVDLYRRKRSNPLASIITRWLWRS